MAASTDLINRALVICGQSQVTAVTQGVSKFADDAEEFLTREMLDIHPWSQYVVRYNSASPTDVSSTRPSHPWEHTFPSEFYRLIEVELDEDEWVVEGEKLYTAAEDVHYRHLKLPISSQWSSLPVELENVMVYLIARYIVAMVSQSRTMIELVNSRAERQIAAARRNDVIQNPYRELSDTSWLESRY